MNGRIFISYRRGDDPGNTGRLFDRLQEAFASDQLFMDVDSIAPGLDFVRVLEEQVARCDVLLAVIGKGWIEARDASGGRRLDSPDDFVCIEIGSALNQGKRVIPILVGGADMPSAAELPEPIKPLARRNALRLTHERFRADTQGLIKALHQALNEVEIRRESEALQRGQVEGERKRAKAHALEPAAVRRTVQIQVPRDAAQLRLNSSGQRPPKRIVGAPLIAGAIILGALALIWTFTPSSRLWPQAPSQMAEQPPPAEAPHEPTEQSPPAEPPRRTVEQPARAEPTPKTAERPSSTEVPRQIYPTATGVYGPAPSQPEAAAGPQQLPPTKIEPRKIKTVPIRRLSVEPYVQPLPLGPKDEPVPPASSSPGITGTYMVQLSSQRSEEDAQAALRALQAKFPAVLGSKQAVIRRSDFGDRGTVYRAQVGPFATSDLATEFCSSLKSAGGQCIVLKN